MKKSRKVLSLILAVVMMFAMTITAFAEDGYSITINNEASGHTYEAYQIFSGQLSVNEEDEKVFSNIVWGSGVSADGQAALGNASEKAATLTDSDKAKEFSESVAAYLTTPAGSANTVSEGKYVISGLDAGYYLIKDKDASLDGKDATYTLYILKVVDNVTTNPKATKPTSEKKVDDKNDSNTTEDTVTWQDSADYDIGDDVLFKLQGTVSEQYDDYEAYEFIFHDTESAGLTFDKDSVKVFVDETEIRKGFDVVTTCEDGCTFEVRFTNLKNISAVEANSVITVEYNSKLNENALIGTAGNSNAMYLEYSNNPYSTSTGKTGKTLADTVIVYTYNAEINKVDKDLNALAGAEFKLEKKFADGSWEEIAVVKNQEGTTFTFKGLDDGQYKLTETKEPTGYNKIDPVYFKISATHDNGLTVLTASQTDKDGNVITNEENIVATFTASLTGDADGKVSTNIVNQAGTVLPGTGGIGTKALYIVGFGLMLGVVLVAVTMKRMSRAK